MSNQLHDIHIGERRWYVVGCSERNFHAPKMFSNEFTCFFNKDQSHVSTTLRAIQGHCSRPTVKPEFIRNMIVTAWMDECNSSCKFPAVPRHNSVEWSDCRENRQETRQASMLPIGPASPAKRGSHTDTIYEMDVVKSTRHVSKILPNIQLCCCLLWRHSSMSCMSRWTRSNDLVRRTIRVRTAFTSNRSRCP